MIIFYNIFKIIDFQFITSLMITEEISIKKKYTDFFFNILLITQFSNFMRSFLAIKLDLIEIVRLDDIKGLVLKDERLERKEDLKIH